MHFRNLTDLDANTDIIENKEDRELPETYLSKIPTIDNQWVKLSFQQKSRFLEVPIIVKSILNQASPNQNKRKTLLFHPLQE